MAEQPADASGAKEARAAIEGQGIGGALVASRPMFTLELVRRRSSRGAAPRASKAVAPAKLFQTTSDYGLMFEFVEAGIPPGCEWVLLVGATVNWLQCLERTTGEVHRHALLETSACGVHALLFKLLSRIGQTDRGKGGLRAERHICDAREGLGDWVPLPFHCEVHMSGTCCERVFGGLLNWCVEGMLHFALVVNNHGELETLQQDLKSIIKEPFA